MLPVGPRYTYPLSATVQPTARDFARTMLAAVQAEIKRSGEVRIATASPGCDGHPVINPLDGTGCNGVSADASSCGLVLYNTTTRSVMANQVGRAFSGTGSECQVTVSSTTVAPADCSVVRARLKKRRRFIDGGGQIYGPIGESLTNGPLLAQLETEYVHRFVFQYVFDVHYDPPIWHRFARLFLDKLSGPLKEITMTGTAGGQGTIWPSAPDDIVSSILTPSLAGTDPFFVLNPLFIPNGLNDATFSGGYTDSIHRGFALEIDGTGTPNTFKLVTSPGSTTTGIPMTGEAQNLGSGVYVTFGSPTGHVMADRWILDAEPNNQVIRRGVAVRGSIVKATPCIPPNHDILVTAEQTLEYVNTDTGTTWSGRELWSYLPEADGSHALVVRHAETLALLYRKTLDQSTTHLLWGDPPQKFCFSTNDEGLFFMHCYSTPNLSSPPSPYPGHEFGSPDPRKVAIISVNPLTFEPTIQEVVTLSAGSGYAVAFTMP